jgi:hypothetical protein
MADGDLSTPMGLREFMMGLGRVMRLPRRKRPSGAEAPPAESRSLAVPLIAAAFVLAIGVLVSRAWPAEGISVPAEFEGVWVSSDPRYANRWLEITPATVHFAIDSAAILPWQHPIRRTTVDNGGVTIVYESAAGEGELRLRREKGGIVFANQPEVIWRRR